MDTWRGTPIIDDSTPVDVIFDQNFARGAVPRDFDVDPPEMFESPDRMQLIPRSEWDARYDEQEEQESSIEHLYLRAGWENLDQESDGYCWVYSGGHCMMLKRTATNQPYVRLSPHMAGAIIKGGRNEGGWCGLGAKFYKEVGCASVATWAPGSRNLRQDTTEMRAEASKYRITSDWIDLARPVYDQNLTIDQVASQLFRNNPCAVDFNHWGHSVAGVRMVRVEPGSFGLMILNSWKGWGRRGLAILRGSKMLPDGAVCIRGVTQSG